MARRKKIEVIDEAEDEDKEFTVAGEIDYQKLLFLLLHHTNMAIISHDNPRGLKAVEVMESNLAPFLDDEWESDMEDLKEKMAREIGRMPWVDKKKQNDLNFIYIKFKLSAILRLMDRRGLLPEHEIEEVI